MHAMSQKHSCLVVVGLVVVLVAVAAPAMAAWDVFESEVVVGEARGTSLVLGTQKQWAFCALSEMRDRGFGQCTVDIDAGSWVLFAKASEYSVSCRAVCVANDGRVTSVFSPVVDYPDPFPNMGSVNQTLLCGLNDVYWGINYMGMLGADCQVLLDRSDWIVRYQQGFTYTYCGGVCMKPATPPTTANWLTTPPDLQVAGHATEVAIGDTQHIGVCVLGRRNLQGWEGDTNECAVYRRGNMWYLYAASDETQFSMSCRAFCINQDYQ